MLHDAQQPLDGPVSGPDEDVAEGPGRARRRRYRKSDPRYTPDHDFRWRAKIRANPQSHFMYRWIVFSLGLVIVVTGLILVPFPGPGWLIVVIGLLVWSSEFDRAQWLLDFVRDKLTVWNAWVMTQHWVVRVGLALLTFAFVCAIVWLALKITGSVSVLPEPYESWVREKLRL